MKQSSVISSSSLTTFFELREEFKKETASSESLNETERPKYSLRKLNEWRACFHQMANATMSIIDEIENNTSVPSEDPSKFYGFDIDYLRMVFELDPNEEISKILLDSKFSKFTTMERICRDLIQEFNEKFFNVSLQAPNFPSDHFTVIKDFLELGLDVGKSEQIKEFKTLIGDIYQRTSTYTHLPFIFVCGSSGTGKTQIPFSLSPEYPFMYFLQDESSANSQLIYKPFLNLTRYFEKYVREDYEAYDESLKRPRVTVESLQHPTIVNESTGRSVENVKTRDVQTIVSETKYQCVEISEKKEMKFSIVGFIVSLFKEMCVKRGEGESWIYSELKDFDLNCKLMTIKEGKEALERIKTDFSLQTLPIIFIDESCVVEGDSGIFQFRRNILRLLNVVVVLMGTNAEVANFVEEILILLQEMR